MSVSSWRRRRIAVENFESISDIRELLMSTGLFHERSNGSFYIGNYIRLVVVPYRRITRVISDGPKYHIFWELLNSDRWETVRFEDVMDFADKEVTKKLAYNLDILLDL